MNSKTRRGRVGKKIAQTLDTGMQQHTIDVGVLRNRKEGAGFRKMQSGIAPTLNARARSDGDMQPVIIARNQRGEIRKMPISGSLVPKRSATQFQYTITERARGSYKGSASSRVAPTLRAATYRNTQLEGLSCIRRLTPVECERLQGFPDGWTEGVSDTQRYKTLGNAVTVNVIQAIMERLI